MSSGPVDTRCNSSRSVITTSLLAIWASITVTGTCGGADDNNPVLQRSGLSAVEPATLHYLQVTASLGSCVLCNIVHSLYSCVKTTLKIRIE